MPKDAKPKATKQPTYTLHPDFQDGDILILCPDDLTAFKVEESNLITHRLLTTVKDSTYQIIIPNSTSLAISLFLKALQDEHLGPQFWKDIKQALRLAERYDCPNIQRPIFHAAIPVLQYNEMFEAFAKASEYNDVPAGVAILRRGYRAEEARDRLRPFGLNGWDMAQADMVNRMWIWALAGAMAKAENSVSISRNLSGELSFGILWLVLLIGIFVCEESNLWTVNAILGWRAVRNNWKKL